MKILGQPESYSDILQRVFYTTFFSGLICTVILAQASPAVKAFLDSVSTEAKLNFLISVNGLKILYAFIPLLIGLILLMLRIHDKISDILRIRYLFDTRYILFPLAQLSGHNLTKELSKSIRKNRVMDMDAVFYPYASFINPKIETQLVRTAADNWGWFWVTLESSFVFSVTTILLKIWFKSTYVQLFLIVILVQMCFLLYQFFECRKSAKRQVNAILSDKSRRTDIHVYFMGK